MKLKLHDDLLDYNITITAEVITPYGDKAGGTTSVLQTLELLIWDAWRYRRDKDYDTLSEEAYEIAKSLHEELKKRGYYKEDKDNETK